MKLRNKKTGEIVETDCMFGVSVPSTEFFGCKSYDEIAAYNSLAELNEEWEDYKPAEPLIEDEKIREAVKIWAKAADIDEEQCVQYDEHWESFRSDDRVIGFKGESIFKTFGNLDDGKWYTIAELCGEEEE